MRVSSTVFVETSNFSAHQEIATSKKIAPHVAMKLRRGQIRRQILQYDVAAAVGRKPGNPGPAFCCVDNCGALLTGYKLYNQRCAVDTGSKSPKCMSGAVGGGASPQSAISASQVPDLPHAPESALGDT
jgi:hypothetical protein